jgi:hypothetical protein
MIIVKSISELVNINDYKSENSDLNISDYKLMFDFTSKYPSPYYYLKFYIINKLQIINFPPKFSEQAEFIKKTITAHNILNKTIKIPGLLFDISIYEAIKIHKILPNNLIDNYIVSDLIDYYEYYNFLYRFFQNKGKVFYSDSIKHLNFKNSSEIAMNLSQLKVLRKGNKEEIELLLTYLSKENLLKIFEQHELNINTLNSSCSKKNIIHQLSKNKEIENIEIYKYFYLLDDDYQEFKYWIEKEEVYFKVFCFLNVDISLAYLGFYDVMKDLKKLNDIDLMKKLFKVYDISKPYFEFNKMLNKDEILEKKISKLRMSLMK